MKLNFEQTKSITLGAVRMEEQEDCIHFFRFTKEQEDLTLIRDDCAKALATSGVKLRFRTNSENLYMKIHTTPQGARTYFAVDVYVNGKMIGSIQNYNERELPRRYVEAKLPTGDFEGSFQLGEGEKEVYIHLPWNMKTVLKEFSLDDGALLSPAKPERKILCYGDSITQGYDALHPSRRYAAQVADYLNMEEFNRGIGSETFCAAFGAMKDDFTPTLITVAYGTNDWRNKTWESFNEECRGFFVNLTNNFPNTPILVITPIWRTLQMRQNFQCGPFRGIHEAICKHTADLPNVTVADGYGFVPQFSDYFADLTLHPNGAGYDRYFEGLKPYLEQYR